MYIAALGTRKCNKQNQLFPIVISRMGACIYLQNPDDSDCCSHRRTIKTLFEVNSEALLIAMLINIINVIHVNRPASGGTVPHFHQMSRGPAKSADVPHFSKMVLLFFSLPIILHVCLATQQSDELRIKIGSKFARRQATDYKYTVL